MNKRVMKWVTVLTFLFGLAGFFLLYQEYRPIDSDGLSIERVRSKDLVADFIYPSNKTHLPVIVFLGGSGGGLGDETELKSLALNGFSVLSLAYFKEEGLPDKLENIPLEYFKNAFDWLITKPQVDTGKLLLLGVSRGAELALLLGSVYPQVKGVVAYSPGCFILPNATEIENDTISASWTLDGSPIPFAPVRRFKEDVDETINYKTYIEPLLLPENPEAEYVIKVEKINGPILLLSGAGDLVWPSSEMSTRIEKRLKAKGFKHECVNFIFEDGGHDLFMFKNCVPILSSIALRNIHLRIRGGEYKFNLGGTTLGVLSSKMQSRRLSIQFLDRFKNSVDKL